MPWRILMAILPICCLMLAAPPAQAENGSLLFDGADDYVTVADPVDLRGPLTLEAWVKVDVDPSGGRIVSNLTGGNGYEMDVVYFNEHYEFRFTLNGIAAAYTTFTGHEGAWTHVAATWAGPTEGTVRLYINGDEVATAVQHDAINVTLGPLRIGSTGIGSWCTRGQYDEIRIWSTALDGATLASWMPRPLAADHPNYVDLEAYWNFDEVSGQTVHNLTGDAGRDGVLGSGAGEDTNDPEWESDGAPVPVYPATIGQIKQRYLKQ